MSALWFLFACLIFYQFDHHEAGLATGNRWRTLPQNKIYKQREDDSSYMRSGGMLKLRMKHLKRDEDYVTQEQFDAAMGKISDQFNVQQAQFNKLQVHVNEQIDNLTKETTAEFSEQAKRITALENDNKAIGFTAYSTKDLDIFEGNTVPYDSVDTNIGGAYDASTYTFTCPVTGLYFFTVTTFTSGANSVIQLIKNDDGLVGALAADGDWDQGTTSWVVQCNKDDKVWCEVADSHAKSPPDVWDNKAWLNSFSGFLIAVN